LNFQALNGLTFDDANITFFAYSNIDEGSNFANFIVAKYNDPDWTLPTSNNLGYQVSAIGLTSLGDFQIGEPLIISNPAAALNFDGIDDKIIVSNGVDLSNKSFSVEMWLKRSGSAENAIAFSQGPNFGPNQTLHIGFGGNGNSFVFNFYQNDLGIPVTADFDWHHWACTFDNETKEKKIYRDGVLIGSVISTSAFLGDGTTDMYIGDVAYGGNNFEGNIDELRVWTRALSQLEIENRLNCEAALQPDLAAAYHFNQGLDGAANFSDIILIDDSENGKNGSLQNFELIGPTSNWVAPGAVITGTVCPPPICIVNIPDVNFKNALLAIPGLDANDNGHVE
jgi:hypothetical protein